MKLKKTIFKDERSAFTKTVSYVGFKPFNEWDDDTPKVAHFLREITRCAGYIFGDNFSMASLALNHIRSADTKPNICIIQSGYNYDGQSNNAPIPELPFCSFEGLSYFQKRKNTPSFKQGLQLARIIQKEFPETKIAIYDRNGSKTQTKQLGLDYIESLNRVYVPLTILEYLRNQNEEVFEK